MIDSRTAIQRTMHLLGLALAPVLTIAYSWSDRVFDYSGTATDRFNAFAADPDAFLRVVISFLALQFALVPAALAFVWLVRGRGRVLVVLGSGMLVVSALGHLAFSGAQLAFYRMIVDVDRDAAREAFLAFDSAPEFTAIAAPGLLGLVLGVLLLGIGCIRSTELPWWIGAGFLAFLVAEFALSGINEWFSLVPAIGWLVAFWGALPYVMRRADASSEIPAAS